MSFFVIAWSPESVIKVEVKRKNDEKHIVDRNTVLHPSWKSYIIIR